MRVFKLKDFAKWAKKEKIPDKSLLKSVDEIEQGLFDGSLGAYLYKKRVAQQGKGKRSSYRTILAFRTKQRAVFMYGYAKNQRTNINNDEEVALRKLAKITMAYTDKQLAKALKEAIILEVTQ